MGFAIAVTFFALWLRIQISAPESGARFATLTLATVVSALFGGAWAGLLSTLLGMTLARMQRASRPAATKWSPTSGVKETAAPHAKPAPPCASGMC